MPAAPAQDQSLVPRKHIRQLMPLTFGSRGYDTLFWLLQVPVQMSTQRNIHQKNFSKMNFFFKVSISNREPHKKLQA